jgi:hypothetical protein
LIWVATKVDKIGAAAKKPALEKVKHSAGAPVVGFSSTTGEGREQLWARIRRAVLSSNTVPIE